MPWPLALPPSRTYRLSGSLQQAHKRTRHAHHLSASFSVRGMFLLGTLCCPCVHFTRQAAGGTSIRDLRHSGNPLYALKAPRPHQRNGSSWCVEYKTETKPGKPIWNFHGPCSRELVVPVLSAFDRVGSRRIEQHDEPPCFGAKAAWLVTRQDICGDPVTIVQ